MLVSVMRTVLNLHKFMQKNTGKLTIKCKTEVLDLKWKKKKNLLPELFSVW